MTKNELKEILRLHALWLEGKRGERASLGKLNLSKANLSGVNLSNADFAESNLSGANFEGSNLSGADFEDTNLSGARFDNAILNETDLFRANASKASFRGANLDGAYFGEANLSGAILVDSSLESADLRGANLTGADLSGAKLDWANLDDTVGLERKDRAMKHNPVRRSKKNPTKKSSSLLTLADRFISKTPRSNPVDGLDEEARFDQFIFSVKASGRATSDWGESEWYEAAIRFGFDPDDASMALEQVAAWGIDD